VETVDPETADVPRRLQHFLQRFGLWRFRRQDGGAATVHRDRIAHHEPKEPADHAERV
jgi:hypothetical protein